MLVLICQYYILKINNLEKIKIYRLFNENKPNVYIKSFYTVTYGL